MHDASGLDAGVGIMCVGNAGPAAKGAACQAGAPVLLIGKAPRRSRGGDAFFTCGLFGSAHERHDNTAVVV